MHAPMWTLQSVYTGGIKLANELSMRYRERKMKAAINQILKIMIIIFLKKNYFYIQVQGKIEVLEIYHLFERK